MPTWKNVPSRTKECSPWKTGQKWTNSWISWRYPWGRGRGREGTAAKPTCPTPRRPLKLSTTTIPSRSKSKTKTNSTMKKKRSSLSTKTTGRKNHPSSPPRKAPATPTPTSSTSKTKKTTTTHSLNSCRGQSQSTRADLSLDTTRGTTCWADAVSSRSSSSCLGRWGSRFGSGSSLSWAVVLTLWWSTRRRCRLTASLCSRRCTWTTITSSDNWVADDVAMVLIVLMGNMT